jgi:erythronate-4-phosphate dehydrogenase
VAHTTYLPGDQITNADVRDADAIITRTRTRCDQNLLHGSAVKLIASATIGFDHIDTDYCKQKGITWTNAPGCNSSSVEQYMLSVLMSLVKKDGWEPAEQTIGVVGVGHVGSKVARMAQILGLKVLLNDPPRERVEGTGIFVSLEQIKEESTLITFHVPLTSSGRDKTYHLADGAFFGGLMNRAWIVNTSRGEVIDSKALKKAALGDQLEGVILDVWEGEPQIDLELLERCRIATPHIAGYSQDGKANGTSMSVRALSRFFDLGLDDWYPENVPSPDNNLISVEGVGVSREELIAEVALQSYDVMRDDENLRRSPYEFEYLRGHYPVRREPGSWLVEINDDETGAGPVLEELGFQVRGHS